MESHVIFAMPRTIAITQKGNAGNAAPTASSAKTASGGRNSLRNMFFTRTLYQSAADSGIIPDMKKGTLIFWLILLTLIVIGVGVSVYVNLQPGKLDSFAQCLKDKGVVYYGAFWCPHCQATNKMFGKSKRLLPYVECSTPDGQGQTQICKDKGITGYPTWVFPPIGTATSTTILTGERTLEELATASTCVLPK